MKTKLNEFGKQYGKDMSEIGLYIHIPFCRAKCHYCDFNSFAGIEKLIPGYFEAMKREIELYSKELTGRKIKTVYIGGGTPSVVDARYLYEIMNMCRQNFDIEKSAEISIESNPGTLSCDKLLSYRMIGINRLSIGLQAWQNRLLKGLGRIHGNEEFVENYRQARKVGFKNINVDLIFGLPGQNINDWAVTVSKIIELDAEHVSCYSLKIEEGTVFGDLLEAGGLDKVDDDLDRDMYELAINKLLKCGYRHYEISNFAKEGHVCRHNLVYWKADRYLGIGAGAHSYLSGQRFNNVYGVEAYIHSLNAGNIPVENIQTIGRKDEISEFMILGLRLIDGISVEEFKYRFNEDVFQLFGARIEKLLMDHLVEIDESRVKLSLKGLDLANRVFVEFV